MIKSLSTLTISKFLAAGLNFVFKAYLAIIITIEVFGEFSVLLNWFQIATLITLFGFNLSLMIHSSIITLKRNLFEIQTFTIIFFVTLSIIVFVTTSSSKYFVYLMFIMTSNLISLYLGYFNRNTDYTKLSILEILKVIFPLLTIFSLNFSSILIVSNTIQIIGLITLCYFLIVSMTFINERFKFNFYLTRYNWLRLVVFMKTGLKSTILNVGGFLLYSVDIIIIEYFLGAEAAGVYALGVVISKLGWIPNEALSVYVFGKLLNKESGDFQKKIIFNIVISFMSLTLFIIFGKDLIIFFYPEKKDIIFRVTTILMISNIPVNIYKILTRYFASKNKWGKMNIIVIGSVIINIILNISLVPKYGIMSAAFTSLFSYSMCGILLASEYRKIN